MRTETSILLSYAPDIATPEEWADVLAGELGPEPDGERLWYLSAELASHRQQIQKLETAIKVLRATDIEKAGNVRYADTYVTVAPTRTRELDEEGLLHWAEHEDIAIESLWRLTAENLRITNLRSAAAQVFARKHPDKDIDDAKEYGRLIESSFVTITKGDPALTEIPIDKAPKYVQGLEHGERIGSYADSRKAKK